MSTRESRKERHRATKEEQKQINDDASSATFRLSDYLCCLCLLPKRFRKEKRRTEREKKLHEQANQPVIADNSEMQVTSTLGNKTDGTVNAVIKMQAVVRGFQGRRVMREWWRAAIEEESAYWLSIIRARELAWLEEERRVVARKQVWHYLDFVLRTYSFLLILCLEWSVCASVCRRYYRHICGVLQPNIGS